ncbi:MAG: bifunctional proline dehydrogenase/L-glutamate gamma-semialdehyde dehydrogenase PutA [Proteobacteria bacterium]|nr:bifunctional proline dehydrogenase/L-glutamate gamma-semialdehyde dehydrogenase PutA [Pseudomonadota bacterium]
MRNAEFEYPRDTLRQTIDKYYLLDETQYIQQILPEAEISKPLVDKIQAKAAMLVTQVRENRKSYGLDAFLSQYDLTNEEGIALMCLAESLLRIPDKNTIDKLIKDKLTKGNWQSHLGHSPSLFVNLATRALMLMSALKKLANKGPEPIVRAAVLQMMKILGRQFVMGRSIESALKRASSNSFKGYQFSFDMLGERALTANDAQTYLKAYQHAITVLGNHGNKTQQLIDRPSISVKLSALHPRYVMAKRARLLEELLPSLKALIQQAKEANIGFTIDAEEADLLEINLDLVDEVLKSGLVKNWAGFGVAVQAYQKRASAVLDWIIASARQYQSGMMIRLVKGAYWDAEIKLAQIQGLSGFPVFTRKINTDLNYIVCAKKLLAATDIITPQFATHNAFSVATLLTLAKESGVVHFEFQCLHGMGRALYDPLVKNQEIRCRIYAPVGTYEDLLAYLVRRLLENGANTSFVNRMGNDKLSVAQMIASPIEKVKSLSMIPHPAIPLPCDLYSDRNNSQGINFSSPQKFMPLVKEIEQFSNQTYEVWPTVYDKEQSFTERTSPISQQHYLGRLVEANTEMIEKTLQNAEKAFEHYKHIRATERANFLHNMAQLLEKHRAQLMSLLIYEGGKTMIDAQSELREAIDYCYYYALQAIKLFENPQLLQGPTGESNQLSLHGRGTVVCISPWNFPLAIFLGQITASLAAGNCVIAKPASQTPLIAAFAIKLLHEAGFANEVVQFLPGSGHVVGNALVKDPRVKGVVFTGSTQTAHEINLELAPKGAIVPFIAETGGQNAMIVDSSALSEQVTQDVIISAFNSAGQRCSALRVLFIQEDVADKFLSMIQGAMAELKVGHPAQLSTDVGPLIDKAAKSQLDKHVCQMKIQAKLLYEVPLPLDCQEGAFFGPCLFEIASLDLLKEEVFGPILHVIRYKESNLDDVIAQINRTGYGLTLGIHSRIDETVEYIVARVNVGNIYVNRNMIGAVVGVQPFGGEGLSGTGPKAGGPYYLPRLALERTLSINTAATGANASLLALAEED